MIKRIIKFGKQNYLLVAFGLIILFVGLVATSRIVFSSPSYVFVKVKVGQGLWWAASQRPSVWQATALSTGDTSLGMLGKPQAEIMEKRVYRWYGSDQFDIYLTLRLAAGYNKQSGQYTFNRSALSVGSPIEVQFPEAELTGTIIDLSQEPFDEKKTEKTVTLFKKYAYTWEFENIKIGDKYFDGEEDIFEVTDKQNVPGNFLSYLPGTQVSAISEPANNVIVKAKVKLKQINGQWILGEDQLIVPGRNISISTPNFVFDSYIVTSLE